MQGCKGCKMMYSKWSIGRQLQTSFATATVIICAVSITLTMLQLDWLYSNMTSLIQDTFKSSTLEKMQLLAAAQSQFISQEFSNNINTIKILKELYQTSFSSSNLTSQIIAPTLVPIASFSVNADTWDLFRSTYFTNSHKLDALGKNMSIAFTSIDKVLPFFYDPSYVGIYQGYYHQAIMNLYPGHYFDWPYTPLVREWFYSAANDPLNVIITEPYFDSSVNVWMVTISQAILNKTSEVLGVMAVDIALDTLTEKLSNVKVLDHGFLTLVTVQGLILVMPETWKAMGLKRIYTEYLTGISEEMWKDMKNSTNDEIFECTDTYGDSYLIIVSAVAPVDSGVTHYVLLFASKTDLMQPINRLKDSFDRTKTLILWFVLVVLVALMIVSLFLIYWQNKIITSQFTFMDALLEKIIMRSLYPHVIKLTDLNKIAKYSKGLEHLSKSLKRKIFRINDKEICYSKFNWDVTRPSEINLHLNWEKIIYPKNSLNNELMPWRNTFDQLQELIDPIEYTFFEDNYN